MPTYVYKCAKCEHTFEVQAKMSDPPPTEGCPECGCTVLDKVIQAVGSILKGSGWFKKGGY
jgi:putative FmdB family regulatory protein